MTTVRLSARIAVAAWVIFAGATAQAEIIVDASPTGPLHLPSWSNTSAGQNFLVQFSLGATTNLTGFDLFGHESFATVADPVRIKIRTDVGGSPSAVNLFSFTEVIDAVTPFPPRVVIASVSFDAILLGAGTYWMGVSGEGTDITWSSYNNGGPAQPADQRLLAGDAVMFTPGIHDLAYRIHGERLDAAVSEPGTLAALGIGLLALMAGARRRS